MVRRQRPSQCVSNKAHIGPHQHVWLSMAVFSCCLSIHNPPLHVHDTHLFWIQACKPYLPIVCEFALKSQSLWHLCPVVIGALYSCCREHKYNKLVLAQHLDDLAESFFMSAMRNGQVLRHLGIACWACVQSAAAYYWAPSGAKYYEAVVWRDVNSPQHTLNHYTMYASLEHFGNCWSFFGHFWAISSQKHLKYNGKITLGKNARNSRKISPKKYLE